MKQQKNKDEAAAKRLLNLYNRLVNLLWSVLGFVPVIVFCYRFVTTEWLIAFLLPALLALFLPEYVFYKMQVGQSAVFYKRMGVHLVNKFSQNGVFIQRLMNKRFPGYRLFTPRRSSIHQLLRQTIAYEKFHFATGLFLVLITLYALFRNLFWWAAVLSVINLFYNIYPILFQQYVRTKLKLFTGKEKKEVITKKRGECLRVFTS